MGRPGIRRTLPFALGSVLLGMAALMPGVASASGGGGCGGPVTDEAGTSVDIEEFCFTPTILRAAPGDVVTFTNRDRTPHTVLGANAVWGGFDTLERGIASTFEFAEAGVYPYVCTWHPGMIGVVVVGDGGGGAIDTTTAAGPVSQGTSRETALSAATAGVEDGRGVGLALAGGAFGVLLGAVGTIGVRRFRRRSIA